MANNNVQQHFQPPQSHQHRLQQNVSSVAQQQQQQQQQQQTPSIANSGQYHCKECGLNFNSGESLEVHLDYHKQNLLNKWATQATNGGGTTSSTPPVSQPQPLPPPPQPPSTTNQANAPIAPPQVSEEAANSNNNKQSPLMTGNNVKREFNNPNNTIAAAADSSDSTKKTNSPEYSRATPEIFGHPPTPQSYQSATSSPYHDNSAFSPNFNNYPPIIKAERNNPSPINNNNNFHGSYYNEQPQFFLENSHPPPQHLHAQPQQQQSLQYPDYSVHHKQNTSYRYHPFQPPPHHHHHQQQQQSQQSSYERSSQVSSSSPAYPPQPTPSPSPKKCDKCGYMCDSAIQLTEHINMTHNMHPYGGYFNQESKSEEESTQNDILDLDSHKVVHQVYDSDKHRHQQQPQQQRQVVGGEGVGGCSSGPVGDQSLNSVSVLLGTPNWTSTTTSPKFYTTPQALPHQLHTEYIGNSGSGGVVNTSGGSVTTTTPPTQDASLIQQQSGAYRQFEHAPSPGTVSSTQVQNVTPIVAPTPSTKSSNWKSNEARRPKTYNCTACNKWFTSSGHLKRHYNTTLHKNAVKTSGHPDPASLPISAHHHPARDQVTSKDTEHNRHSTSPVEDDTNSLPPVAPPTVGGICQPPPLQQQQQQLQGGVPPALTPTQAILYDRMLVSNNNNSSSPPNGEAGLSPTINNDSRGLLSTTANNNNNINQHHNTSHLTAPLTPQHSLHHLNPAFHGVYSTTITPPGAQQPLGPPVPALLPLQSHPQLMGSQAPIGGDVIPTTNHTTTAQFHQMTYPNESAPHVTQTHQDMATTTITNNSSNNSNSPNITGEQEQQHQQQQSQQQYETQQHSEFPTQTLIVVSQQPLPSFAQIQSHRYNNGGYLVNYDEANVGGGGAVTAPYTYFHSDTVLSNHDPYEGVLHPDDQNQQQQQHLQHQEEESYKHDGVEYQQQHEEHHLQQQKIGSYGILEKVEEDETTDYQTQSSMEHEYKSEPLLLDISMETQQSHPQPQPPASPEKAHIKRDYEETVAGSFLNGRKIEPATNTNSSSPPSNGGSNITTIVTLATTTTTTTDPIHKCVDCDKLFNKACYLTQHNKTFHCGDKPFKCSRCGKRFSSDVTYQQHLSKHAGDKPHKCDVCPKQFNHKTDLRRHMCLHTGNKPYMCGSCGKGFIRKDHMVKHCETHLKKTSKGKMRR